MRARRATKGKGDSDIGPTEAEQSADLMARAVLGAGNPSDGILAAEAAGQAALVESAVLPRQGLTEEGHGNPKTHVPDGLVVEGDHDDLFARVTLPPSWTKVAQPDHSMWSYLLDDQGRQRAGIFYKAAFYDRKAMLSWRTRYNVVTRYFDNSDQVQVIVTDAPTGTGREGAVLWESEVFESYDREGEASKAAEKWLKKRRPNWRDPAAYWDDAEAPA